MLAAVNSTELIRYGAFSLVILIIAFVVTKSSGGKKSYRKEVYGLKKELEKIHEEIWRVIREEGGDASD